MAPAQIVLPTFVASALAVALCERLLPYRREWNRPQGDLAADAAYLPTTWAIRGLLDPVLVALAVAMGGWLSRSLGTGLWPGHWPLLAQLALACAIAELFDYWVHRAMHQTDWLWRLHATHHSAPRLYWLNATRAHPGEIALRGAINTLPLAILGANEAVLALVAVTSITVGLFQHANIDFALGPLSWIFSVGELHRWHHAPERQLANTNYGNNFIVWDAVFGTRYRPSDREPPNAIGIAGLEAFPRGWLAQVLSPLRWSRIEARSGAAAPGRAGS